MEKLREESFSVSSEEDYQGPLAKPTRISSSNLVYAEGQLSLPWGLDPLLNVELDGSNFAVRLEALSALIVGVYSLSKGTDAGKFKLECNFGLVNSYINLELNSEADVWKIEYRKF